MHTSSIDTKGCDRSEPCLNERGTFLPSSAELKWGSVFEEKLQSEAGSYLSDSPSPRKPTKDKKPEDVILSLEDLQREVQRTIGPVQQDNTLAINSLEAIAAQVVEAMLVLNSPNIQGQAIRLNLNNLGLLDGTRLEIQLHKQQLTIAFFAQEGLAYDFLKKKLPELQKVLEAKNLSGVSSMELACHTQMQFDAVPVSDTALPFVSSNARDKAPLALN